MRNRHFCQRDFVPLDREARPLGLRDDERLQVVARFA